jgi:hypothetical protein
MGRKRRGGYTFVWFKGDHSPGHVHVYGRNDHLLGRVRLDNYHYLEGGRPPAIVIALIKEFQAKGIL